MHGSGDEETRASLQARIAVYTKIIFFSFTADILMLTVMYAMYPEIPQHNSNAIAMAGACGLAVLAVLWRGVLARNKLSIPSLYRIDVLYSVGIGTFLAAGAYFRPDLRPASYSALTIAYGMVFARVLIVPSSARRSAALATATFVPLLAAGIGLAKGQELPPPVYVGAAALLSIVAILIAAVGSDIIYGLRRQVSEAMQLGQYTLDRKIGEGGMGTVYRARHALLRRPTAVKILKPERIGSGLVQRFEREGQHMSQLPHPNTLAVYDHGRNPHRGLYYAVEDLEGLRLPELAERLRGAPVR